MTPAPERNKKLSGLFARGLHRVRRAGPLVWLITLMVLSSGVLVALVLGYLHSQAIAEGRRLTTAIAIVSEEQTNRLLQTTDQRLQLAAADLAQIDTAGGLDVVAARALLRRNLESLPHVRAIWVMDSQGRITQDSDQGNIGVKLADRAYFQHHLANPQSQFVVGAPVRSRTTGTWLISASRPLKTADGRFAGIIVAALEPPYLEALWRTIDLGSDGSIALFRRDGVLLARSPHDDASMGKSFSVTPLFSQQLASQPAGNYQASSAIDGVLREFSYRTLSTQPDLVVVVGQSYAHMLARWNQFAWLVVAIWLLSALLVGALGLRVARTRRGLERSESALRHSEQNLAITLDSIGDAMIATDAAGRVTRMNPAAERLTGWPLADARGRPLAEVFRIISAQTRLAAPNPVQLVMDSGQAVGLANHTALLARDGREYQIADSAAPIRDAANTILGVVLVFSDVTEKYRAEQALRDSEQRFRDTFRLMPAVLVLRTEQGVVLDCSDAFCSTTGYVREEVVGRNMLELNLWAEPAQRDAYHAAMLRDGQAIDIEFTLRQRSGTTTVMQISARYLTIGGERLLLSFAHDVSLRRRALDELQATRDHLEATLDAIPDLLFQVGLDGRLHGYHTHRADLLAAPPEAFLGKTLAEVLPAAAAEVCMAALREAAEKGLSSGAIYALQLPHGEHWFELSVAAMPATSDGEQRFILLTRDITARKQAELALQAALREKTALLNEVHHRVKNNLQVVASLLRLERGRSSHAPTRAVLNDMQGRVRAMALLHESIYRAGTFAAVDLGAYAREIATQAFGSLRTGADALRLRLDLSSVQAGLDQATTCGLLLTELISNALKHGFPDERSGEVCVSLQPVAEVAQVAQVVEVVEVVEGPAKDIGGTHWCLRVSDNGVGLPADFAARQQDALGLQLVQSLADQLGGSLIVDPRADAGAPGGASFSVTFTVKMPTPLVLGV